MGKSFKEVWNQVDETCPSCNQVTKRVRGLNRQNVKRLFSFKMTIQDAVMLVIILLVLLSAYAYKLETGQCRDFLKKNGPLLEEYYASLGSNIGTLGSMPTLDFSLLNLDRNDTLTTNSTEVNNSAQDDEPT